MSRIVSSFCTRATHEAPAARRSLLPRVALACLLALAAAPAAQAQFCTGDLGSPIGTASIPLNVDEFGDLARYTVVVFGNPKATYEVDEGVPTMEFTVYDGPNGDTRCLVLEDATPPRIERPFLRAIRFFLKAEASGGDTITELRLLADLATGSMSSPSPVHIEIQEIAVPFVGGPCDDEDCIKKSKMISISMTTGATLRPKCGSAQPSDEIVEGEGLYSDFGEFTVQGAECIAEFGGAAGFNAPFLFRITGEPNIICQDGYDNDGDGQTDLMDLGCLDEFDITEEFACEDGLDDDGDGLVDHPEDPGCSSADDDSEKDPSLECDDGIDNDGMGDIDLEDPDCMNDPLTAREAPEPTLFLLQVSAMGLLAALRRRRS